MWPHSPFGPRASCRMYGRAAASPWPDSARPRGNTRDDAGPPSIALAAAAPAAGACSCGFSRCADLCAVHFLHQRPRNASSWVAAQMIAAVRERTTACDDDRVASTAWSPTYSREADEVTIKVDEATNTKLRMTLGSIAQVSAARSATTRINSSPVAGRLYACARWGGGDCPFKRKRWLHRPMTYLWDDSRVLAAGIRGPSVSLVRSTSVHVVNESSGEFSIG